MQNPEMLKPICRPWHLGCSHLIMLALCLVLTGCAYVDTPEGKTPLNLQGQETAWTGYWFDGEMMIRTRVENAEQGTLQAAWIDTRDNSFALEKMRFLLRKTDDKLYANAEVTPGSRYLPLRITKSPRSFVLWGLLNSNHAEDKPDMLTKRVPELYETQDYKVFMKLSDGEANGALVNKARKTPTAHRDDD